MTHVYNAIVTKKLAPTNFKPARFKATCTAGSITVSYDHALEITDNHIAAARALMVKVGWDKPYYGKLVSGALPNGGYCHVFDFSEEVK